MLGFLLKSAKAGRVVRCGGFGCIGSITKIEENQVTVEDVYRHYDVNYDENNNEIDNGYDEHWRMVYDLEEIMKADVKPYFIYKKDEKVSICWNFHSLKRVRVD